MIEVIPLFKDNYSYLIYEKEEKKAILIDPGEAGPILSLLQERELLLEAILLTHHHQDHVGGVAELISCFPSAKLFGSELPISSRIYIPAPHILSDHKVISIGSFSFIPLSTPGHTKDHFSFFLQEESALFSGDALFLLGCGRLFEGTALEMERSLFSLTILPEETKIYCGHEYTEKNLSFVRSLSLRQNPFLELYAKEMRERGGRSVPGLLSREKLCNPFLRCREPAFQEEKKIREPHLLFQHLRQLRDHF